jgi:hypothetical protein
MTHIGFISLPQFLEDSFEIFLHSEAVQSNTEIQMINKKFIILEGN